MATQFDKTTNRKSWKHIDEFQCGYYRNGGTAMDDVMQSFFLGRNSVRASLEAAELSIHNILKNPVATGMGADIRNYARRHKTGGDDPIKELKEALAQIRANGDSTLEDGK